MESECKRLTKKEHEEMRDCPQCNGTGMEQTMKRDKPGPGWIREWRSSSRRCGRCAGSGSVPNKPDCDNCGGAGQIWRGNVCLIPCPDCKV